MLAYTIVLISVTFNTGLGIISSCRPDLGDQEFPICKQWIKVGRTTAYMVPPWPYDATKDRIDPVRGLFGLGNLWRVRTDNGSATLLIYDEEPLFARKDYPPNTGGDPWYTWQSNSPVLACSNSSGAMWADATRYGRVPDGTSNPECNQHVQNSIGTHLCAVGHGWELMHKGFAYDWGLQHGHQSSPSHPCWIAGAPRLPVLEACGVIDENQTLFTPAQPDSIGRFIMSQKNCVLRNALEDLLLRDLTCLSRDSACDGVVDMEKMFGLLVTMSTEAQARFVWSVIAKMKVKDMGY